MIKLIRLDIKVDLIFLIILSEEYLSWTFESEFLVFLPKVVLSFLSGVIFSLLGIGKLLL